jgi:hypothetical protein
VVSGRAKEAETVSRLPFEKAVDQSQDSRHRKERNVVRGGANRRVEGIDKGRLFFARFLDPLDVSGFVDKLDPIHKRSFGLRIGFQEEKGGEKIGFLKVFPDREEPLGPFRVGRAGVVKQVTFVVEKGGRKRSCLDGSGKV